jgi:hypothetical protein
MSKNMNTLDRRLRAFLIAPAAAVAGVLVGPGSVAAIVLYVIAAVMLATSAAGYCPLYTLLRLDTRNGRHSRPLTH